MDFANFDLNLLRVLHVLLRERSVTRAAANLCVTQQAVSNSLRRLRDQFHDPLLVRVGRNMEPSLLAQAMDQPLREALLHLETVAQFQAQFDPAKTVRNFRLRMSAYATFLFLPQVLRRLSTEAPRMTVQTVVTDIDSIVALERRGLDLLIADQSIGFSPMAPSGEKMRRQFLLSDDFVCVADKDHPDLKKGLTLERYLRLSHCVTRFPGDSQSLIERTWSKLGLQIRAGAISPGFMVTLFTLSHTGLIGTVPRKLAVLHADSLGLRIHKSPVRLEPIDEYLFWHPIDDEDPAHGYLRSLFQSCAQRLPKLGRALGSNGSLRRVPPRTSVK